MIYTIGHSTRTLDEFVALLHQHKVAALADVRTVPRSRHVPHFNRAELAVALPAVGIDYVHLAQLGGLRHGLAAGSPNAGWRNASFRGFADYMQTEDFDLGLAELLGLAESAPMAMMCAEAVPWRCHRSLIADALLARGIAVCHIVSHRPCRPHQLTRFALVEGHRITYPEETD